MAKAKEDLKLIDYLKEKDISYEDVKKLIDEHIDEALEKEKDREVIIEPEPEPKEPEAEPEPEVPPFTLENVSQLVHEEVKNALKIKRKTPSKGKIVDQEPESIKDRNKIKRNFSEVLV